MPHAALRLRHSCALVIAILALFAVSSSPATGQVQVLTEHNDLTRSGANTAETLLNPVNVNFNQFGKLFTQNVDGLIVGQPLYLSAVKFPDGSTHNVVYVATQHDSVFAFDGDNGQAAPLWSTSFINPAAGITTVPIADYGCGGTAFTEIGIVSTPVIDATAGTLFVVAKTLENGTYVFRLHALSITTGADVITPEVISASTTNNSGTLQFNPAIQMQRPALLLVNGTIYIGFGSNGCDTYAYNGWLLAYDETSLQPVGVFVTTPNGSKGAIWEAGGGPAADTDGTLFLATGNGTFDASTGGLDYGDTMIHLTDAAHGFAVLDYFTPFDQQTLADTDEDLGSGGVILLPDQDAPHTHELLGGGKAGTLYVVDRDNMGGYNQQDNSQIVQSIPGASTGELDSVPAYWNNYVFIQGQFDTIKAFSLANDMLSTQPVSQSSITAIVPGSISISAQGTTNGILWAVPQSNPAFLYALDPTNLSTVLYSSNQAPGERDQLGSIPKFVAPTVANGKVYIGGTSALTVYGLFPLISVIAGNNQSAYVGTTLPVSLQIQAVDAYQGNPIANVSVTCKDGGVNGTFGTAMPMLTDSNGLASTTYTLPKKAQTVTITCSGTGYYSGIFTEVGVAGPVTRGAIVSGNNQTGSTSTQLPAPLVMQVLDPYSFGVPGVTVTFSDGGAGGSFSSASVITDSVGDATTLYTASGTPGTVTITASTAGITPVKFSETIVPSVPGFTLSASPSSLSVVQGSTTPSTITVNPTGGFTGSVALTASGLPAGVTASFNPSSTTGTSTLTLTATASASLGPATITITGASGSITQTTSVNLTVVVAPSFTLSASPSTLSIALGNSAPSTITVSPTGGFTGSVALTASGLPTGVTASFNPTSTTGTSTLTLTASTSAALGPATITITGTSGSIIQTTTVNLTVVVAPSFTLSASPNTLNVAQGSSLPSTITVNPTGGFSGSVTLTASGLPAGVTASFNPSSTAGTSTLTLSASASATLGPATITITGTSGSIAQTTTVNLTVVVAPSFTLSASPNTLSVVQGSSVPSTITVNPTGGFSGGVTMTASSLPAGVTASFNPSGTTSTSTLTLTASGSAGLGAATITIAGTSGSITQTTMVNLTVVVSPSFTLSASPNTLSVVQGSSAPSTITVSPTGGFSGSVALSASGLPAGVTASFNPSSTTGTSTLTLTGTASATLGPATITITGTSASITQHTTINLTVTSPPSYSLAAGTPSPASIKPGSSSTAPITITSANSYTGSVTLSCRVSPVVSPAASCALSSPNPVSVGSSGGSATLSFTTVGSTSAALQRGSGMLYAMWLPVPGLALIGLGFGTRSSRRKKFFGILLLTLMLSTMIVVPGCGGGPSPGGTTGNSGTPAGTYTITITAKDAANHGQSNTAPTVSVIVN